MTASSTDPLTREDRLNELLLAYLEAQGGQGPEPASLIAAHPEFRDELAEFFAGQAEVERRVVAVRASVGLERADASTCAGATVEYPALPVIGQLGDFRLLCEIGRGGMGVVYEAEQISLRRRVALKVLPFAGAIDARQLQRFKNEAMAAAHLHHEHIVPVFAVGEERGVHYYAMQYIEGQSLAALITEWKSSRREDGHRAEAASALTTAHGAVTASGNGRERRDYAWVARLGLQAARALKYAHSVGVVHRDIKPANLLLDTRGQLWVADFGLAQVAGDPGLTVAGEMLGTLRYASPEQMQAKQGITDHRADLYSLGATLYELLTLQPLFDGRDRNELLRQIADQEPRRPSLLRRDLPIELETIVLKLLSKEAAGRYATADDLSQDLERFLDHRPIYAKPPSVVERLRKVARRHPSLVMAAGLVLVLISTASLVSAVLIQAEQARTQAAQQRTAEAYRSERQRAIEAETRFRMARRSVDEMFRISQHELAGHPGLESLRKRMLWSVLAFYQEFVEQRRDDVELRAELVDAKQRVEKILSDLTILRAASQLYLLTQPVVLDELNLSNEQREKVKEFCDRVGQEWWQSFEEYGRLSPNERERRAVARARVYEAEVQLLFDAEQRRRLDQIGLRAAGPGAFSEPEVISLLRLSEEQREQVRLIEAEQLSAWVRGGGRQGGDGDAVTAGERVQAALTDGQRRTWQTMIGRPLAGELQPFPGAVGAGGGAPSL